MDSIVSLFATAWDVVQPVLAQGLELVGQWSYLRSWVEFLDWAHLGLASAATAAGAGLGVWARYLFGGSGQRATA